MISLMFQTISSVTITKEESVISAFSHISFLSFYAFKFIYFYLIHRSINIACAGVVPLDVSIQEYVYNASVYSKNVVFF